MAIIRLPIEEFLPLTTSHLILDTRSPIEFASGHMPTAHSFPIFSDEERKEIGTTYKQNSRQEAVKIGLNYFGKKMVYCVEQADNLYQNFYSGDAREKKKILLYCWRGGMRSAGMACLLDMYGFNVIVLIGGYKSFRNWVLQQFTLDYPLHVVGGYTGSGKTELLHTLKKTGEKIIDLEGIARHKGSAYGNCKNLQQPTQEMFENEFALCLKDSCNNARPQRIWIEDESQRIGNLNIPTAIFTTLRQKKIFFLDIPFEKRLTYIVETYSQNTIQQLVDATYRIQKRLGGLNTQLVVKFLKENNLTQAGEILLHYYDKWYRKSIENRAVNGSIILRICASNVNAADNANVLLQTEMKSQLSTHL